LWGEVDQALDDVELLGPPVGSDERLPNTVALSIGGIDGRMLIARLDLEGLEASAGSACASGSLEPSHVLLAMGLPPERARSGLRLSFGRTNAPQDVHAAVEILRRSVQALR
jgi:cysteine desulfurase